MSSIRDKMVRDLSYKETRFAQLSVAHQSTLLVYTRGSNESNTRELARKLKPEFSKVFVATQLRECNKLIRKHDSDESLAPIDVIVSDFDSHSVKLLEFINKRPQNKDTLQFPLISTIMILPDEEDTSNRQGQAAKAAGAGGGQAGSYQAQITIDEVGGASHVYPHQVSSKDLLNKILDILARRKQVESAYKDLKGNKMKAGKYPFMPLFSSKRAGGDDNDGDHEDRDDDDDADAFATSSASSASTKKGPIGGGRSVGSSVSLVEMDDWTDTSSMLPDFVGAVRTRMGVKMSADVPLHGVGIAGTRSMCATLSAADAAAATQGQRGHSRIHTQQDATNTTTGTCTARMNMGATGATAGGGADKMDFRERTAVDKNITRFLQSGRTIEELEEEQRKVVAEQLRGDLDRAEKERLRDEDEKKKRQLAQLKLNQDSSAGLDQAAPSPNHPAASEAGDDGNALGGGGSVATGGSGARPHTADDDQSVMSALSAGGPQAGPDGSVLMDDEAFDEATYTQSPRGSTAPPSPVGSPGRPRLNTGASDFEAKAHSKGRARGGVQIMRREIPNSLGRLLDPSQRPVWKGAGRSYIEDEATAASGETKVVDMAPFIRKDRPSTEVQHSVGGLNKTVAQDQWKIINLSNYQDAGNDQTSLDQQLGAGATSEQNLRIESYLERRDEVDKQNSNNISSSDSISQISQMASVEFEAADTATAKRRTVDRIIVGQATKTLKRLARDSAPDVQLNSLMRIRLESGKVSIGDKDILEAGVKAEKEGHHEVAITMYKRAGLHTSKPHLSKMFLAVIHFQLGKFMHALDFLDSAVESQDKVRHLSQYSRDDHFVAFFNRTLVNFRLGNDDKGLLDIRAAIDLNPSHIKAREVLGLALRRVTRYGESIEISKQNLIMRREHELQRGEEARVRQELEEERTRRAKAKRDVKNSSRPSSSLLKQGSVATAGGESTKSRGSPKGGQVAGSSSGSVASLSVDYGGDVLQVMCPVEDKGGSGSMKSRKLQKLRLLTANGSEASMPGEALKTFKLMNGFQDDLYEGLFTRPSPLQSAMLVPPDARTEADLDTIGCTLKLFPFLWPCADSTIRELTRVVEYRALQNRTNLYVQNNRADAVCFLLRGSMQGKLENLAANAVSGSNMVVAEVAPYDTVGQIDMLFDSPRSPASKALVSQIEEARAAKMAALLADVDSMAPPAKEGEGAEEQVEGVQDADDGEDDDDDYSIDPETLPRCVQNKMFVTYSMTSACELLILKRDDFNRLLYQTAYDDLTRRISVVEGCRVFTEWNLEEKIRLARMGQVQVYRSGKMILKQGAKPAYLSLIVKGMCKSYKSPNKSTVLRGKLVAAQEKAARFDLKYVYHHKLRDSLTPGALVPHPKASEKHKASLRGRTHVTVSEALRYSIGIEIKSLTKELAKALEVEERLEAEELSLDDAVESITSKLSEISTLQWPMLFGESCLLDPEDGTTRGTIVADTTLHALSIHKSQLQTFRIRENLLERIKYRCVKYPEDEELLRDKEAKEVWEVQRQAIIKDLNGPKEEYLEPFYV